MLEQQFATTAPAKPQAGPRRLKYKQTYDIILARLENGYYPVGSRLPAEQALVHIFDVSRATVRRALDILVRQGYLERRHGSGYSVLTLSPVSSTCLSSFTDAVFRSGREPSARMIGISRNPAHAPESAHLFRGLRGQPLTRIKRLRLVDDKPHMLVHTWAPTKLMPDAGPGDFPERGSGQSMLRILKERFGIAWSAACEDISPVAADHETAAFLRIPAGAPLLLHACAAFDDADAMVFAEEAYQTGKVSFDRTGQSRVTRFTRPAGVLP